MAQCKTHIFMLGGSPKTPEEIEQDRRDQADPSNPPPPVTLNEVRSERVEAVQDLVDDQGEKIGERRVGVQYTMEDAQTGQRFVWNFDRS